MLFFASLKLPTTSGGYIMSLPASGARFRFPAFLIKVNQRQPSEREVSRFKSNVGKNYTQNFRLTCSALPKNGM